MLGAYEAERLRRHNEHEHYSSGRVFLIKYEIILFSLIN